MKNLIVSLKSKAFVLTVVLGSSLLLVGCDPFGNTVKKLSGRYFIQEFDEALPTTYYIIEKGVDSGGGVFDGIIKEIGWKGNKLIADVQRLSSVDSNGWYLLDLNTGKVEGPITDIKIISSFSTTSAEAFFENPMVWKK